MHFSIGLLSYRTAQNFINKAEPSPPAHLKQQAPAKTQI